MLLSNIRKLDTKKQTFHLFIVWLNAFVSRMTTAHATALLYGNSMGIPDNSTQPVYCTFLLYIKCGCGTTLTTTYSDKPLFRLISKTVTNKASNITLSTIDTIEGNKIFCTQQQIVDAENTKKLQKSIGLTTKKHDASDI